MEYIQSKQNAKIKHWRKLLSAKGRRQSGTYLIEGPHLIEEAIKFQQPIKAIMVDEMYQHALMDGVSKYPIYILSSAASESLSATLQPQGIYAEIELLQNDTASITQAKRLLLIDRVQDPGNLGTMIRTADAAGFDAVVLGEGTVDLYNDKVLRATQGSLWHLPVVSLNLVTLIEQLKEWGVRVYATALHQQAVDYREISSDEAVAIIVGNEGSGVEETLIEQADKPIYIPMQGQAESLNVAVASGIIMFQLTKEK